MRYGGDSYILGLLWCLPKWLLDPLGRFIGRTAISFLSQGAPERKELP